MEKKEFAFENDYVKLKNPTKEEEKEIIELIKENKYGWNLVSEEKADEGIEEGTYYAKIIIPKDFSKELFGERSIDKDNVDIKYILNQKLNPIASKMADSGANDIKDELNGDIITYRPLDSFSDEVIHQLSNTNYNSKTNEFLTIISKLNKTNN